MINRIFIILQNSLVNYGTVWQLLKNLLLLFEKLLNFLALDETYFGSSDASVAVDEYDYQTKQNQHDIVISNYLIHIITKICLNHAVEHNLKSHDYPVYIKEQIGQVAGAQV